MCKFASTMTYKFPKSERLTNKQKIERLFAEGKSIKAFPLRLVYIIDPLKSEEQPFQFAFTVPKRRFKKAVDRNYIKRRMREAFRLNKLDIQSKTISEQSSIFGIFIFMGQEKMTFQEIEKAMKKIIAKASNL